MYRPNSVVGMKLDGVRHSSRGLGERETGPKNGLHAKASSQRHGWASLGNPRLWLSGTSQRALCLLARACVKNPACFASGRRRSGAARVSARCRLRWAGGSSWASKPCGATSRASTRSREAGSERLPRVLAGGAAAEARALRRARAGCERGTRLKFARGSGGEGPAARAALPRVGSEGEGSGLGRPSFCIVMWGGAG